MNSKKIKSKLKRIVSAIVALAMTATTFSTFSVAAEQQNVVYPYAVFAVQNVKINTEGFTLNGNAYSKGDFVYTSKNASINGKITDADDIKEKSDNTEDFDVNSDLILIHNKIANKYFSSDCDKKDKDYSISDVNVNINKSVYVTGKLGLNGNINLNNAVGAVSDIDFSGGTLNGNSTVIYSKFGNINISNNNSSVSGLIYAPFGTVTISGDNFNFDGVIIAENIIIKGKGANINYNKAAAMIVGSESEKLSCDFSDWKYIPDNDKDGLPDLIEKEVGTDPEKEDTDGDKLPDGYEALTLGTDPTKDDTDGNGTKDCDEDQDKDGLTNFEEYNLKTNPNSKDSDKDNLSDGDEINKYKTDPLKKDTDDDGLEDDDEIYLKTDPKNPDTNGNGVKDGDEKFSQTFTHKVKNKDCAVTEVSVSMKGTGNLQKTTTVDSVMNKDMLCTGVVGLVGEPFSVETKSKFDKATLTFKIDKTKLGNTKFDNLMFLWYNEKENNFVELETKLDSAKSTASIETTHFSKYMVVDKQAWFDNWRQIYESYEKLLSTNPSITSICVDCSGSMSTNDPSFQLYDHTSSCYRNLAVQGFADAMLDSDKTSIITFEHFAKEVCSLTNNKDILKNNARFYNGGGTNANSAIDIALKELKNESGNKSIILMSDGDVNVTDANIKLAKDNSVKIHTVGLGSGADNKSLKEYAQKTGGEHFIVKTAAGLEAIYKNISDDNKTDLSSLPDSDGDGVPDEVEQVYGIPMPDGELVFTDPEEKDTDGDGLTDGQEIDYSLYIQKSTSVALEEEQEPIGRFVFKVTSNPTKVDTDNDELNDYEELLAATKSFDDDTDGDGAIDGRDISPHEYNNGHYDRSKAIEYAYKWSDTFNENEYPNLEEGGNGDCANFISQCLYAGDIEMNYSWHMYPQHFWNRLHDIFSNRAQNWSYEWTLEWAVANDNYNYFKNNHAIESFQLNRGESVADFIADHNNIQAGDLLYFHHTGSKKDVNHATIITKVTNNEIFYSGHTDPRKDHELSEGIMALKKDGSAQYTHIIVLRMSDSYDKAS